MHTPDTSSVALLVHGKNWEVPIPADPSLVKPSFDTNLSAEAAGILFTRGLFIQGLGSIAFKKIILSGGYTAGPGPEYPAEADALYDALREDHETFDTDQITDESILWDRKSHDTATNFTCANELYEEHGITSIVPLTVWYHAPRVRRLGNRLSTAPIIAVQKTDAVVRQARQERNHFYARSVIKKAREDHSLRPVARVAASLGLEVGAWGMAMIDPTGDGISKVVTTRLRNQSTDSPLS